MNAYLKGENMVPAKSFKSLLITGVVMSLALLVLSGCNKGGNASGAGSPSSGSSSGGGTQVAGGEGLFKSNGCGKCLADMGNGLGRVTMCASCRL